MHSRNLSQVCRMEQVVLAISDISAELKILFMNETKQNEIWPGPVTYLIKIGQICKLQRKKKCSGNQTDRSRRVFSNHNEKTYPCRQRLALFKAA
jgi:hypothetical protein